MGHEQRLNSIFRTTKWAIVSISAPYSILMKALIEYISAVRTSQSFKLLAEEDNVSWTLTHTYLANTGGFIIKSKGEHPLHSTSAAPTRNLEDQFDVPLRNAEPGIPMSLLRRDPQRVSILATALEWNKTLALRSSEGRKKPQGCTLSRLGAQNILDLREAGLLARLPDIKLEEINDKSKMDALAATLDMIHGMLFVLPVILILQRTMAESSLDTWATVYIMYTILIYSLKWSKPRGITVPFIVASYKNGIPPKVLACIGPLNSTTL